MEDINAHTSKLIINPPYILNTNDKIHPICHDRHTGQIIKLYILGNLLNNRFLKPEKILSLMRMFVIDSDININIIKLSIFKFNLNSYLKYIPAKYAFLLFGLL